METTDSMIKAVSSFISKKHLRTYLSSLKIKDVSREMNEIEKYVEQECPEEVDNLDFWDLIRTKLAMDMLGV